MRLVGRKHIAILVLSHEHSLHLSFLASALWLALGQGVCRCKRQHRRLQRVVLRRSEQRDKSLIAQALQILFTDAAAQVEAILVGLWVLSVPAL